MARIGLIDVDNTGFPNLALMKISAYHKSLGDTVEFVGINNCDITYISKVFTFSPEYMPTIANLGHIIKGGTGYDLTIRLPIQIDNMLPDYSIYGIKDKAYGFLTRGCNRKCPWCVVPEKEGKPAIYRDIEEILQGRQEAIIMDNNILSSAYGIYQIEKIVELGIKVDFNQGLDARLVSIDIAKLLSKVKWIRSVRFACDSDSMVEPVIKAMDLLVKFGIGKWRFDNYLLLNGSLESAYYRANEMRKYGASINPQPFRSFKENNIIPQWQKDFARWGNKKQIYRTVDFKDYKASKGFLCGKYFESKSLLS